MQLRATGVIHADLDGIHLPAPEDQRVWIPQEFTGTVNVDVETLDKKAEFTFVFDVSEKEIEARAALVGESLRTIIPSPIKPTRYEIALLQLLRLIIDDTEKILAEGSETGSYYLPQNFEFGVEFEEEQYEQFFAPMFASKIQ